MAATKASYMIATISQLDEALEGTAALFQISRSQPTGNLHYNLCTGATFYPVGGSEPLRFLIQGYRTFANWNKSRSSGDLSSGGRAYRINLSIEIYACVHRILT